ncbi:hypothetical protein G6O67_001208 [Ophiocordyceps sinensis]|uniref:Uncharacterized protein n=1 Tax=Ophiocordyceps sinensis TaxID=72228 RepID=A0A8H4PXF3_9HYPO|nr:hypothetical protein G6O67_001208 [Ophiocordyceps sinensis]
MQTSTARVHGTSEQPDMRLVSPRFTLRRRLRATMGILADQTTLGQEPTQPCCLFLQESSGSNRIWLRARREQQSGVVTDAAEREAPGRAVERPVSEDSEEDKARLPRYFCVEWLL